MARSKAANVLDYFKTAPIEEAWTVLEFAKAAMKERAPSPAPSKTRKKRAAKVAATTESAA